MLAALLAGVVVPSLASSRCKARDAISQANLQQIGIASGNYAGDFGNTIFNFSWENGVLYELPNGRRIVVSPNESKARVQQWQQAEILMRVTGRFDGSDPLEVNTTTIPHRRFRYLTLLDYLSAKLPEPIVASPHDLNQIRWQSDPTNAVPGVVPTNSPPAANTSSFERSEVYEKWPYASSYVTTTYTWSADTGELVLPSFDPYLYQLPPGSMALRRFDEVVFPSQKVQEFEEYDRCKNQYWAYEDSEVPQLFFDGSVQINRTGDANLGWNASNPSDQSDFFSINFYPIDADFFPPALFDTDGDGADDGVAVAGRFLWTRGGLRGVDYGGDEIDTTFFADP